MVNLTDLGFSRNTIAETIVSTYSRDGKPNAAPMGATMENDAQLVISVFDSSLTSQNLRLTRCAVVNLTSDIDVFYKATFKEANPNGILPLEWFKQAVAVNAPQLCMAEATVEVAVADITPIDAQKSKVTCNIKRVNAEPAFPKAPCRAFSATLEAIIYATRVKAFADNPAEKPRVGKLVDLIGNCSDVVERTAPNSPYSGVMKDLTVRVNLWRVNR
ncbi:MAG: DUF447 family protein [Candidatus Bathyarchaeota archaeon]|nr:DUF447 family protein [Candidatus Bathyarchaeota archaeon]